MKKCNTIDVITWGGILATLLLLFGVGGCSMKFYKSPSDIRKCCDRMDVSTKAMSQFNRYCKVALSLSRSQSTALGKGVRDSASSAVKVCKFVFNVDTDDELVAAGDEQEYQRVHTYVVLPENEMGWRKTLDCDPDQPSCEEF
mgnify:CR=1 FL=1